MTLTKEAIDHFFSEEFFWVDSGASADWLLFASQVRDAALAVLAVQPRPIEELPPSRTDKKEYLFRLYDGTFVVRLSDKEWWINLIKDDPTAYKGHLPEFFYDLSSLPKVTP